MAEYPVNTLTGLAGRVWALIRPLDAPQRFLAWCGTLLVLSGVVHAVVAAADGSSWWGAVSWRKPVAFGLSLGLFAWSVAWVLRQLPARPRIAWPAAGVVGAGSVVEGALITMQRWRGVPSHFNSETAFDAAVFGVMGMTITLVTLAVAVLLAWSLVEFRGDAATRVAVVAGLCGVLAAGVVGAAMVGAGEAEVAASGQVPDGVVFGAAGSAKLAHAAGLHAIQVLGLLCIALALGPLPGRTRLRLMAGAAAGYTALFASVTATAAAGRAWTQPSAPMALLGLVGVVALAAAATVAVRAHGRLSGGRRAQAQLDAERRDTAVGERTR